MTGAAIALALAVAAGPVLLVVLDYHPVVVSTDSMSPTMAEGDLSVTHAQSASAVRADDVISYSHTTRGEGVFTERVLDVVPYGSVVVFTTRGDGKARAHQWTVPATEKLEVIAYNVPMNPLRLVGGLSTGAVLVIAAVIAAALGLVAVRSLGWRQH